MAKLQKPRPVAAEQKKTNPTWIGTKLDALREKMYTKEQVRYQHKRPMRMPTDELWKALPKAVSNTPSDSAKKVSRLTKFGGFLQRKGRAPKSEVRYHVVTVISFNLC